MNILFWHVARLAENTPAHQTLRCHVEVTVAGDVV